MDVTKISGFSVPIEEAELPPRPFVQDALKADTALFAVRARDPRREQCKLRP